LTHSRTLASNACTHIPSVNTLHTRTSSPYTYTYTSQYTYTPWIHIHALLATTPGSFRTASGDFGRIQVCLFVEHMALLVENRALLVGHTALWVEHRGLLVDFSFLEHGALLLEHRALLAEYRALYCRTMLWNTCTHKACAFLRFVCGLRTQKCTLRYTRTHSHTTLRYTCTHSHTGLS